MPDDAINARRRERWRTDLEYRERENARTRERRKDPEYREKEKAAIREYRRKRMQDPEYRERMNARSRARRQDPTYRAREKASRRERRRKRRANDPEYRDRMNARQRERYHRTGGRGPRRHWRELYVSQGGLCGICGYPMQQDVTVDHKIAAKHDGSNELANLQAAHVACNSWKKDRDDWHGGPPWAESRFAHLVPTLYPMREMLR